VPSTHTISAEEWQLLAFFGVEPTKLDADVLWPYSDFIYDTRINDLQIAFAVMPAHRDFTLKVCRGHEKQIELSALSVFDIRYHEDHGAEWLEILITEYDRLELRLNPSFSITGWLRRKR
jgi:hypothetical protein